MAKQSIFSGLLAALLMIFTLHTPAAEPTDKIWIDVRTAEENQESSIPGHPNILYTDIADKISTVTTDKNAPIYLYCRTGRRSGIAKETLEQLGYTNVTNAGGIDQVREQLHKP